MASVAKTLLRSIMKMVNSVMAIVGIAMILYGLWMVRVWQRDMEESPSTPYDFTAAWFIYSFLSIGVTLCLITCLGHISADSSNGFCLSCYTVIISMLVLVEIAVAADILLNSDWEKDLPEDPTGRFHDFEDFVKSNFDAFKLIGLLIILAQGLSMLLAMALRAVGLNYGADYDSDDEYHQARLPLIYPHLHPPPYAVGDPALAIATTKNDIWKAEK